MLFKSLKKYWLIFLFLTVFIILRLPSLFEPYWYGDEGIYLVLGQAIRRGSILYRQIHDNKPPTLYYLAAISQTVFGFRLLLSLWMIPTIYAFYLLSKKLLSKNLSLVSSLLFLVLTSIPLFEGNIANAEIFMLLPTLLGVYIFLLPITNYKLLITGLLLGFAFTIKIPVFIEFGFLCFWLLIINKKSFKLLITDYCLLISGFILSFALYFLYFAYHDALKEFIFSAILQNFGYLSSWSTGTHSGSATSGGLIVRAVILLAFWLITFILTFKKYIPQKIGFLSFWFSSCIFGTLLSTRPYPHYLIQVLPPLVLLIFTLFEKNLATKIRYFILCLIFILIFSFVKYKFYVYPVFSYYGNFYSHISNLSSPSYRQYFGNGINRIYDISNYVSSNTSATDKIFVWGDSPFIYALPDRAPSGKYVVAYHIVDFGQHQSVYDELKINFPKLIIYYPQDSRPYPELDSFISRYYFPVKVFGDTIIFERLR